MVFYPFLEAFAGLTMTSSFFTDLADIRRFWNKECAFFPKQQSLSDSLPSASNLISLFTGHYSNGSWVKSLAVNINASRINNDGSHQQLLSIGIEAACERYLDAFTICFGDLATSCEQIAALKDRAAEFFGFGELIAVTGYLSPPNSTGVLHYDRQHNFFIQREGTKRWFVSEKPATPNPHDNLVYTGTPQKFFDEMKAKDYHIALPKECGRQVFELNPGDVLYVPPGFYHSPETLSSASLHYTLTLEPACFWRDFTKDCFLKMLSNNGIFMLDYRFITDEERRQLINDCIERISNDYP